MTIEKGKNCVEEDEDEEEQGEGGGGRGGWKEEEEGETNPFQKSHIMTINLLEYHTKQL